MKEKSPFDDDYDYYEADYKPAKTDRKKKKACLVDPKEGLTMLTACEAIVQIMEGSGLSKTALKKAQPYLKYVADLQQISEMQALFLALVLNESLKDYTFIGDLSELLDCRNITILRHTNDLDELVKKHLLFASLRGGYKAYRISTEVIDAFRENKHFVPAKKDNLTPRQLMHEMMTYLRQRKEKEIGYQGMVEELHNLMNCNPNTNFVQKLRDLKLNETDEMIVIILAVYHVIDWRENVSLSMLEELIPESAGFSSIACDLIHGWGELRKNGIVEQGYEDGYRSQDSFCLSSKIQESLFFDFLDFRFRTKTPRDVIQYKSIKPRPMFYNERTKKEIDRLGQLISYDNYYSICERLEAQNMPKAFTCLFYGAPGTGKTETVYQLASQTHRDVMKVDLSQLRDKYVGESEKQVKAIFKRYSELFPFNDAPILLFNEADAIFGRRTENVDNSIDKMENAIQNIILEEMENFEGILIATTNLTGNFDQAFERRFLYKVNFEQPNLETRKSIWHAMLPQIDVTTTDELAQFYNFSGAQIQNVARRLTVETALYGEQSASVDNLKVICQQESLAKKSSHIGF